MFKVTPENVNSLSVQISKVTEQAERAISFTRKQWEDNETSGTTVTAQDLNRIEQAIQDLNTNLQSLQDSVCRTLWKGTWRSGQITVSGISCYTLFLVVVSNGDSSPGSDETRVGYVGHGSDSGRFYAQANFAWEMNRASATAVASLRCSIDGDVLSNPIFGRINVSADFTYFFQGVRKIIGIV